MRRLVYGLLACLLLLVAGLWLGSAKADHHGPGPWSKPVYQNTPWKVFPAGGPPSTNQYSCMPIYKATEVFTGWVLTVNAREHYLETMDGQIACRLHVAPPGSPCDPEPHTTPGIVENSEIVATHLVKPPFATLDTGLRTPADPYWLAPDEQLYVVAQVWNDSPLDSKQITCVASIYYRE